MVDTDILSLFLRGHPMVVARFATYLAEQTVIPFSIVTYYEIVSGLKHRDARKQLQAFLDFARQNVILPLTEEAADLAAERYAELRLQGQPIDDIDLLIAGTALAQQRILVTRNREHFQRIAGLEITDWST